MEDKPFEKSIFLDAVQLIPLTTKLFMLRFIVKEPLEITSKENY